MLVTVVVDSGAAVVLTVIAVMLLTATEKYAQTSTAMMSIAITSHVRRRFVSASMRSLFSRFQ